MIVLGPRVCFLRWFTISTRFQFNFTVGCPEMLKAKSSFDCGSNLIGDIGVEAYIIVCFLQSPFMIHSWTMLDFTVGISQALANAMPHNQTLTDLRLRDNDFGGAGRQARWVARSEESLLPRAALWDWLRGMEANRGASQGEPGSCCKGCLEVGLGFGLLWNVAATTDLFVSVFYLHSCWINGWLWFRRFSSFCLASW